MKVNGEAVSIIKRRRLSSCGKYKMWYMGGTNCSSFVMLIETTAVVERHTLAMWPMQFATFPAFSIAQLNDNYTYCENVCISTTSALWWMLLARAWGGLTILPRASLGGLPLSLLPRRHCSLPPCTHFGLHRPVLLTLTVPLSAASNVRASSSKSARGFL